ncbi:hypothetical protein [Leifsonia aquatica]|uniref:hypothetical protein n=1 Tax=Leifsonia aquatica TaxID=144185 RepID=UPI00046A9CCF|nr:hypothetical protein [Leifsonia aquatica]
MNVAPTAFLFRKKHPHKAAWSEWDYLLVEAVQSLEAERCRCGLPVYICHSDDPRIRFRVEEDECEAQKAVDIFEEREQKRAGENWKKPHGVALRPVPYTTDGSDFASYRDSYYVSEDVRRREVLESLRVS